MEDTFHTPCQHHTRSRREGFFVSIRFGNSVVLSMAMPVSTALIPQYLTYSGFLEGGRALAYRDDAPCSPCVYIWACRHIRKCMCALTCMHTGIDQNIYTRMHTCTNLRLACPQPCICTCICSHMHGLKHRHKGVCLHVCLHMHVLEACMEPTEARLRGTELPHWASGGCPIHLHLSHTFWKV